MTFWELITNNSALPIQAGNTFWDHINNQKQSGGENILVNYNSTIDMQLDQFEIVSTLDATEITQEVSLIELDISSTKFDVDIETANLTIEIEVK